MNDNTVNARCGACNHVWIVAHLPMALVKVAQAARQAVCPKCGEAEKIFVAAGTDAEVPQVSAPTPSDPAETELAAEFAAWCSERPSDSIYPYFSPQSCAGFLFFRDTGAPIKSMGGTFWRDTDNVCHAIPASISAALEAAPATYGALHERLLEVSAQ